MKNDNVYRVYSTQTLNICFFVFVYLQCGLIDIFQIVRELIIIRVDILCDILRGKEESNI